MFIYDMLNEMDDVNGREYISPLCYVALNCAR